MDRFNPLVNEVTSANELLERGLIVSISPDNIYNADELLKICVYNGLEVLGIDKDDYVKYSNRNERGLL